MGKDKKVVTYPDSIETRVALVEMAIININETMKEIKSEIKATRLDISELRKDMHEDMKWLLGKMFVMTGFLFGTIAGLGAIMAHGFHWF